MKLWENCKKITGNFREIVEEFEEILKKMYASGESFWDCLINFVWYGRKFEKIIV